MARLGSPSLGSNGSCDLLDTLKLERWAYVLWACEPLSLESSTASMVSTFIKMFDSSSKALNVDDINPA